MPAARSTHVRALLVCSLLLLGSVSAFGSAPVEDAAPPQVSVSLHELTQAYAAAVARQAPLLRVCMPAFISFDWLRGNAGLLEALRDARSARALWRTAAVVAASRAWPLRELQAQIAGVRLSLEYGDFQDGQQAANAARSLAQRIGDPASEGAADFYLSNVLRLRGDVNQAQTFATAAADIAQRLGDHGASARALTELAIIVKNKGDYLQGLEYEIGALREEQPGPSLQTQALTLSKLGKLYEQIEDNAQALEYQDRALELARRLGDRETLMHMLASYANTLNDLDPAQNARALDYAEQALKFARETGNRSLEVDGGLQVARAYFNAGRLDAAAPAFAQALATASAIGQKVSVAHILLRQGELFERTGRLDDAIANSRSAIELYQGSENLPRLIKAYAILERQLEAGDDHAGATTARLRRFELRDRVLGASAMRDLAQVEAGRAQDAQKQRIELLTRENEIDALRIERATLMRWMALLLATTLGLALILVILRFQRSLRMNRLLRSKNEEILAQQKAAELANAELQRSAEQLRKAISTDALTGAFSRTHGLETLAADLAVAAAGEYSVLLIDVDLFKLVNDRYGHLHGDRVLARIADQLHAGLRGGDCLVRFGGEEFLVLLPRTGVAEASALGERLRARIERSTRESGPPLAQAHVTISVGVCGLSQLQRNDLETLIDGADQALYAAKRGGRNRVVVYRLDDAALPALKV